MGEFLDFVVGRVLEEFFSSRRGVGWLLITFAASLGMVLAGWILWPAG